jgi:glycosyltransferase involved in cell wall biosynthesis
MDRPQATVIIPAFDAASTVGETLDSVVAQTLANYQVVVVDDGSTDGTPDVVAARRDPRMEIVRTEHRGVAHARNVGSARARGEIVAFLDADDLWLPDTLATQVSFLTEQPDVGVVFGDCRFLAPDGPLTRTLAESVHQPARPTLRDLLITRPVPLSTVAIRLSVLRALGGFDASLESCEDYDLWYRALARQMVLASAGRVLAVIRIRPDGLSASLKRYRISMARVLRKLCAHEGLGAEIRAIALAELAGLSGAGYPAHERSGRAAPTDRSRPR